MEQMWSPWRSKYIDKFKHDEKESACFLCTAADNIENDNESMVVYRQKNVFIIMNKFPYNNGHLLVAPYSHFGDLTTLNDDVLRELMFTARDAVQILKGIYNPHAFNLGMNLGRAAGAGLPDHLHYHIIPRWNGDTSFTATVADVKVISYSLEESFLEIKKAFIKKFGNN